MPVLFPKPKRSIQDASRPSPRRCAIVIVPMFEEYSTIWRTVMRCVPRAWASWIVRSATLSVGGSRNDERGFTIPSWSPAATVTSLKVDPGSYVSVTARLRRRSARVVGNRFALNRGAVAMARISPVSGSITTAVADLADQRRTVSARISSAFAWI
jgi:hypothetical protein